MAVAGQRGSRANGAGTRPEHRRGLLRHLARGAAVPVFVARGCGAGLAANELAADARLVLVDTPRRASLLVAVGAFPGHLADALERVHDQLPHPRAFVVEPAPGDLASLADRVVGLNAEMLDGALGSYDDIRADRPPNPFEGLGDHGQGGEGMMGGVPWGRPMAMTGDDRDGLSLDRIESTLGPFLVGMPTGTAARVVAQGGVIQECELVPPPTHQGPRADGPGLHGDRDHTMVRSVLHWLVDACRLGGLDALAVRAARASLAPAEPQPIRGLCAAVRRSGLSRTWRGIGAGLGGDPLDAAGRLDRRVEALDAFARSGDTDALSETALDPAAPGSAAVNPATAGLRDGTGTRNHADARNDNGTGNHPGRFEEIAEGLRGLIWSDALVALCSLALDLDGTERLAVGDPAGGAGSTR